LEGGADENDCDECIRCCIIPRQNIDANHIKSRCFIGIVESRITVYKIIPMISTPRKVGHNKRKAVFVHLASSEGENDNSRAFFEM
jgi:hypothetical protein